MIFLLPLYQLLKYFKASSFIRRRVTIFIFCLINILFLTSCEKNSDPILGWPEDFGTSDGIIPISYDTLNITVPADGKYDSYNSYGRWYETNLKAVLGASLEVVTYGSVSLCSKSATTILSPNKGGNIDHFIDENGSSHIFTVKKDDHLFIKLVPSHDYQVGNKIKISGLSNVVDNCIYGDGLKEGCWAEHGMGLEFLINNNKINNPKLYFGLDDNFSSKDELTVIAPINGRLRAIMPQALEGSQGNGSYTMEISTLGCHYYNGLGDATTNAGKIQLLISDTDPNPSSDKPNPEINEDNIITLPAGKFNNKLFSHKGKIWLKVLTTDDPQNALGSYKVNLKLEKVGSGGFITSNLKKVIDGLNFWLDKSLKVIYGNFVSNNIFVLVIKSCLTIYIIFYAIGFMYGIIQASKLDFVIRLFKISLIVVLMSQYSWSFFGEFLVKLFREGSLYLVNLVLGNVGGELNLTPLIEPLDGSLFNWMILVKLITLLSFGIFKLLNPLLVVDVGEALIGLFSASYVFVIFYFVLLAYFTYFFVFVEVLIMFVVAMLVAAIMIAIAPIFIIFILFNYTKSMFDNWLKYLLNIMLQPVIMIAAIVVLNQIVIYFMNSVFSFYMKWGCVNGVYIKLFGQVIDTGLCLMWWVPTEYIDSSVSDAKPLTGMSMLLSMFIKSLILYILVKLMGKISDLAYFISGTLTGMGFVGEASLIGSSSIAGQGAAKLKQGLSKLTGTDQQSKQKRDNDKESEKEDKKDDPYGENGESPGGEDNPGGEDGPGGENAPSDTGGTGGGG